jgi:hypothetical protein
MRFALLQSKARKIITPGDRSAFGFCAGRGVDLIF